jgi:predicted membrane-bound mannosyltransferase
LQGALRTPEDRLKPVLPAGFLAISPAMVYYNRYYIPETLLVLLTALLLAVILRYVRQPRWSLALGGGTLLGLMFVTKETAAIAIVCIAAAAVFGLRPKVVEWRHLLAAFATAAVFVAVLVGPRQAVESMSVYASRGLGGSAHAHPWYYYFQVLGFESLVVVLALVGAIVARSRFFAIFTLGLAVLYSAIPYKTPWCVLGFLYGCAILAGFGVASASRIERRWLRAGAYCAALILGGHLTVQAYSRSRQHAADPRNPYAYAHTTRDVYRIVERIERLARAAEEGGDKLAVQVISSGNVWPLPWYLRRFPEVEWRRAVTEEMRPAPVILATPDMEAALLRQMYEVMPPGQRPLYVPLFEDVVELRPGVEVRGYVRQSLGSVLAADER